MLAATTKLGLLARFLAVLTAVLSVRTVLWDHTLATGVGAFIRVSHERIASRSLYASEGRMTRRRQQGKCCSNVSPWAIEDATSGTSSERTRRSRCNWRR